MAPQFVWYFATQYRVKDLREVVRALEIQDGLHAALAITEMPAPPLRRTLRRAFLPSLTEIVNDSTISSSTDTRDYMLSTLCDAYPLSMVTKSQLS